MAKDSSIINHIGCRTAVFGVASGCKTAQQNWDKLLRVPDFVAGLGVERLRAQSLFIQHASIKCLQLSRGSVIC